MRSALRIILKESAFVSLEKLSESIFEASFFGLNFLEFGGVFLIDFIYYLNIFQVRYLIFAVSVLYRK